MGQIVQPAMLVYRESAQKIGGNICKNSPHRSPTCFQLWRPHVIASCSFWWGSFRWILRSVGLRTKPCCMPSSMTRCGDDSHGGIQHFKNIRSFFFGMLWWVLANFFGLALNPFWGFGRRLCWTFVVGIPWPFGAWHFGGWYFSSGKIIWMFPKIGVKPPKSSILIGFSIINHPFWGTPIFGNTHLPN